MTNAVWKSPPLPLLGETDRTEYSSLRPDHYAVGSGQRFKMDLMSYLRHYDRRRVTCGPLVDQLSRYDFSAVKGALIASVPGKHNMHDLSEPAWGWPALKRHLSSISVRGDEGSSIVIQISSIATLGAKDDWLRKSLFESLSKSTTSDAKRPEFKVVFPTPDEIRRSLDGYDSGASIHTKIQSQQQAKQLQYLRPILHHWANDAPGGRGEFSDSSLFGIVIALNGVGGRNPSRCSPARRASGAGSTSHQDVHPIQRKRNHRLGAAHVCQSLKAGMGRGCTATNRGGADRIMGNWGARLARASG